MREIGINGQTFKLPENWIEVPKEQLPEILRQLYVLPESGSTYHEIVRLLLGYRPKAWQKLMRQLFGKGLSEFKKQQSATVLTEIIRLQSWMWKADLTVAPCKMVVVDGKPWYLFEENFKSMSFGEMSDAYIHSQAFIKQLVKGEERLDMLVATVCRPERMGNYEADPTWNGDRREPYNEHIARKRVEMWKGQYTEQKVLILMYFLGTMKEFFSYFDLFESDGSKPPMAEEYPGQSMVKNQHLLSEKQIFGGMDATKSANVHEVFQFLEEHNKDVKAEIERNKAANKD